MSIKLTEPLETPRLLIRQLTQEDYNLIVEKANIANTEENYNYFKNQDVYCFLLQIREPQRIIGYVFLRTFEGEAEIECHYALFPQYTGNGYAIEAMRRIFEYLFENYEYLRIVAYVEQGNIRGWKVAERSGMKYMGDIFHTGKNSKVMYFLLNKSDYINQYRN
ncbi:MAG: GNAT family N-acetyltransferase [Candidatus Hermodarchaeota archaeon]